MKGPGLIFVSGQQSRSNFVDGDRARHSVGHVGIIGEGKTVLHACWKKDAVVADPLEQFLSEHFYRGIYKISG